MKIEYSYYSLTPVKQLNNFSNTELKQGVYIRIDNQFYLDYFPWSFFGDLGSEDFLNTLKQSGLPHWAHDLLSLEKDKEHIEHKPFLNHGAGEKVQKVKVVMTLDELIEQIKNTTSSVKLRLDFNNKYTLEEILNFWSKLKNQDKAKIDYLEDPCPNMNDEWAKLQEKNIPLANDRNPKESTSYDFEVFKPNCESFKKQKRPQIFSSYMGADLGRYHCYLSYCQNADETLFHGIHTPGIYNEQRELFIKKKAMYIPDQSVIHALYDDLKNRKWEIL